MPTYTSDELYFLNGSTHDIDHIPPANILITGIWGRFKPSSGSMTGADASAGSNGSYINWYDPGSPVTAGNWSPWYADLPSIPFLAPGVQTTSVWFTLWGTLAPSYFQFKYDYTLLTPTPTGYIKIKTNTGVQTVRLADPADPNLVYTSLRMYQGGAVHCIDIVDTDYSEASPLRIYHPLHGTLAFRKVV